MKSTSSIKAASYLLDTMDNLFIHCFIIGFDWTLIIEDNGEGIAANKLDKIFDMFYRNSEQSEGIGLGLYICKESIQRLGGQIETHSTTGKGNKFIIQVPNQHISIAI